MTDRNTVFTEEGAKSFADTYCMSCDAKQDSQYRCIGETAEHCKAFRKNRHIRHETALVEAHLDKLFGIC